MSFCLVLCTFAKNLIEFRRFYSRIIHELLNRSKDPPWIIFPINWDSKKDPTILYVPTLPWLPRCILTFWRHLDMSRKKILLKKLGDRWPFQKNWYISYSSIYTKSGRDPSIFKSRLGTETCTLQTWSKC